MQPQWIKDLYFSLVQPVANLNGWRWQRMLQSRKQPLQTPLYLNLGSGAKYLNNFVNIEGAIQRPKDMWLDLRNPLPFRNNSVDGIYTCHVLEHFYMSELTPLLRECYRVLKPGGGIRILVPSVDKAIAAYVSGDHDFFSIFPEAYESMGGKFYNLLLCAGQHRIIFDFSFMEELLLAAGFPRIHHMGTHESHIYDASDLDVIEEGYIGQSLVVEAFK